MNKEEFKVETVALKGSNLIEASAGTGKTFSIGILVLRLILEKNLSLNKILMVTFTKAAVAELEIRIRKFIREAQAYARNKSNCDKVIRSIVKCAINTYGEEVVLTRLRMASTSLDDTAIFTIHSFCQKTLNEFAFETGQMFGAEVMENSSAIINDAINEYWRQDITTLPSDQLQLLVDENISRSDIAEVVSKALSGKYFVYNRELNLVEAFGKFKSQSEDTDKAISDFDKEFNHSVECQLESFNKNKSANNNFADLCNNSIRFRNNLLKNRGTKYVNDCFPNLLESALACHEALEKGKNTINEIKYFLYGQAIASTKEYISFKKQNLNVFAFDDLIQNLATAVENDDANLLKGELQKKYEAVFIDEFQDTDKIQYDIFNSLFEQKSILFYIGDPKQSIYGFRGADIDTYKHAAAQVDKTYTMSHNFRSTPNMLAALNAFFTATKNAFCDDKISYETVQSGMDLPEMKCEGGLVNNMTQTIVKNKNQIHSTVASEIFHLLTNDYSIADRKVKPSDIAVLVRTKKEGEAVKAALGKMNIPSVTIDDSKVLQSKEALFIMYVLQACLSPDKSNINRALYNQFTTFSHADILTLDDERELERFRMIKEAWLKNGVYDALTLFTRLYNLSSNLLNKQNDERSLTNILQIIELLHKAEINQTLSSVDLISWLQRMLAGADENGDEFVQRVESDEDAVQITTIHSSKGLAYNIVFAPYLDMDSKYQHYFSFIEYKDPKSGAYCFSQYKTDQEKELYTKQTEQENRRLIYVALTRTVYKAYVYTTQKGSVKDFIVSDYNCPYIEKQELKDFDGAKIKLNGSDLKPKAKAFLGHIDSSWRMHSFSALNRQHKTYPVGTCDYENEYDEFIFSKLTKGNIAGNFLHELFENADFSQVEFQNLIKAVGKSYPSVFNEEYINQYNQMMMTVLHANLSEEKPWCLQQTDKKKMIPELEFFFDINAFTPKEINLICEKASVEDSRMLEGFMTGFIDLFFEHEGKYYILDWKSNFLGNALDDYSPKRLDEVMTDNNYHLQYLIYTIAVKRYLEMRLPDFNYERDFGGVYYVFLRGCRAGGNTGIFYAKPDKEMIETMDDLFLAPRFVAE
ncbi:UvrD-helicase domain-containing protein [Ancylomarina sp. YFZ004]